MLIKTTPVIPIVFDVNRAQSFQWLNKYQILKRKHLLSKLWHFVLNFEVKFIEEIVQLKNLNFIIVEDIYSVSRTLL